jgi:hypothetical protein
VHSSGLALISVSKFSLSGNKSPSSNGNGNDRHLSSLDWLFWVLLRRFWSGWKSVLIVVKPDTVGGWHRAGFGCYWRWKSRRRRGRPRITTEIRELIARLAKESAGWGSQDPRGITKARF